MAEISLTSILEARERLIARNLMPDRLELRPGDYTIWPGGTLYGMRVVAGDENAVCAPERPHGTLELVGWVREPIRG